MSEGNIIRISHDALKQIMAVKHSLEEESERQVSWGDALDQLLRQLKVPSKN